MLKGEGIIGFRNLGFPPKRSNNQWIIIIVHSKKKQGGKPQFGERQKKRYPQETHKNDSIHRRK